MRQMFSKKQIEELAKTSVNEGIESGEIQVGSKLYKHTIVDSDSGYTFILINDKPNTIDFSDYEGYDDFLDYLVNNIVISFYSLGEPNNQIIYLGTAFASINYDFDNEQFILAALDDWSLENSTDSVSEL